jgi:hypothetical protein
MVNCFLTKAAKKTNNYKPNPNNNLNTSTDCTCGPSYINVYTGKVQDLNSSTTDIDSCYHCYKSLGECKTALVNNYFYDTCEVNTGKKKSSNYAQRYYIVELNFATNTAWI